MFEDVPDELNRDVLNNADQLSSPALFPLKAALAVTRFYLGTTFADDKSLVSAPKVFPGVIPPLYVVRMSQLANAVFSLRNEPGFPEICRRLSTRPLGSAFFESHAAAFFRPLGFSILARPETQVRTQDFDFALRADGVEINVEATALKDTPHFSEVTIRNTLTKKRKQVPADKPAIIVCWVPNRWRTATARFEGTLEDLAKAFLRGTRRVNYLFFAEDIRIRRGNNVGMLTNVLSFANENPRHGCEPVEGRWQAMADRSGEVREVAAHHPACEHGGGTDEFHRWLDWLQSRL